MDSHCSNTDSSSYIFVVSHPAGMNDLHDALRSRSSVDPTVDEIQTIVEHLQRENDELKSKLKLHK